MRESFKLTPVSIEDLEAAEESKEFLSPLASTYSQIFEFRASNPRCNDHLYGQIAIEKGVITDLFLDRTGCSLSRASIVIFGQQLIGAKVSEAITLTDDDFVQTIGSSHPMRNECILFGIKSLLKAISPNV